MRKNNQSPEGLSLQSWQVLLAKLALNYCIRFVWKTLKILLIPDPTPELLLN